MSPDHADPTDLEKSGSPDIYRFLEETPPDWVIAHWGELAQTPRCPLDLFHANPRFFLSWVLIWEKTAKNLFLPWEVT